jgi:hypothetical protein
LARVSESLTPYLAPIITKITDKNTQKQALQSALSSTLFSVLFISATVIYSVLYAIVLPSLYRYTPIHLEYHDNATISNHFSWTDNNIVHLNETFDLYIILTVPESDHNFNIGNIMISTKLYSTSNQVLLSTKRPSIMVQKTALVRTLESILSPFVILAYKHQKQVLRVPLIEKVDTHVSHSLIKITSPMSKTPIQTYDAQLCIKTYYTGFYYLIYEHWFITGVIGVLILVVLELILIEKSWSCGINYYKRIKQRALEPRSNQSSPVKKTT